MYDTSTRQRALALLGQGLTVSEVSRRTGVSRHAIREWQLRTEQGRDLYAAGSRECPRCSSAPRPPEPAPDYSYLLGLYLGDGCISPVSAPEKKVWALRIACANAWPGLIDECVGAVRALRPDNRVRTIQRPGCVEVNTHSKHWPCLFPQHGPGRKHERRIELAAWQREIVHADPRPFVRGLLHSDGCRPTNRVRRPSGDGWYEYPRYLFTNVSADIRGLYTEALDLLGISWKQNKPIEISVARREAVARLDGFVGPKH
ncbi:hypothetical protein GCM10009678_88140 [Actinomadura kijaniata]|uniref:Transcriptional regulator n=1 Tax=Actinomadura namibiensis TaxID=182080 RepID=A0A7W3QP76_ACTNM|nr:helix-turn-helix domain-containing protein [Actinomadura namibiensis]MBA8953833.1 hypothetical protein [Actinomadura namibiensis]